MRLLKNRRAWKKWCKDEGLDNQEPKPCEPATYPCFAYCTVLSFGYEEKLENYIFKAGVESMLKEISDGNV